MNLMPDETKPEQKPASLEPPKDLEELLKELPKVESKPAPPTAPPLVPPPSRPLSPNPTPPQTTPPPLKAPESGAKPPSPPLAASGSQLPASSFKSSIRTMAEDLEAAKKGLKPESKPFEIKPPPPAPKIAPPPPPPGGARPFLSSPRLGAPEKSKIIEAPKIIPPPPAIPPSPPPIAARPPLGLPSSLGRKLPISPKFLLLILGGIVVIASAWYFLTREDEEAAAPTPVITQTPTPAPTPKTISELIPSSEQITISSTENFATALNNQIKSLTLTSGNFTILRVSDENKNPYTLGSLSTKLNIGVPGSILDAFDDSNWALVLYGQNEMFDDKGLLNFNQTPKPKLGLIIKTVDLNSLRTSLRSGLNTLESAMANDFKNLFGLDLKKASGQTFLDNIYSGVNIRYRNFPYADNTIDYAIVDLPEFSLSYLVLTNSREAIYSAVNLLQNQ